MKPSSRRTAFTALITTFAAFLIATLASCDDFSLIDELGASQTSAPTATPTPTPEISPPPLALSAQRTEVERFETTALYPSGGTAPYAYEVLELSENLYYTGNPSQASASNNSFTAGDSVGAIIVRVRDASGTSAEIRITIRPLAPQGFAVSGAGGNNINISWTFSEPLDRISGFTLERAVVGGDFATVAALIPSSAISYSDTVTPNITFRYRLYSVAGPYRSLSTPELSDTSN